MPTDIFDQAASSPASADIFDSITSTPEAKKQAADVFDHAESLNSGVTTAPPAAPAKPLSLDLGAPPSAPSAAEQQFGQQREQRAGAPLARRTDVKTPTAGTVPVAPKFEPVPDKPQLAGPATQDPIGANEDQGTGAASVLFPEHTVLSKEQAHERAGKTVAEAQAATDGKDIFSYAAEHPEQVAGNAVFPGAGEILRGGTELQTPGERLKGGVRAIGGATDVLMPSVTKAFFEAPVHLALGLSAGVASEQLGPTRHIVKKLGGDDDAQEAARQVDFWLPTIAGSLLGLKAGSGEKPVYDANGEFLGTVSAEGAGSTKAGVSFGHVSTPTEHIFGVKLGERTYEVRVPRGGAQSKAEQLAEESGQEPAGATGGKGEPTPAPKPQEPQAAPVASQGTPEKSATQAVASEGGERPVVQASDNPAALRKSAEEQQPKLEQMAEQAVAQVPGAKLEGSRVKDGDSQQNKEERGKPSETNIDHLGGRVSAKTPEEVAKVEQTIEQTLPVVSKDNIDSNGLDVTQYGIQTGKPGDANQVSELQVLDKPQADALKKTDPLYEQQKEALARGDQAEADRIGKQIEQIHQQAQPERRRDTAQRKDINAMSPEEKDQEISRLRTERLTDPKFPNFQNQTAWNERTPERHTAFTDMDGLGAANDKFGHDAGDALLTAYGEAFKAVGLKAYRVGGDEVKLQGSDDKDLTAKLEQAREHLAGREFLVTDKDGKEYTLSGLSFSYGLGTDDKSADKALYEHKSQRAASGERAAVKGQFGRTVKLAERQAQEHPTPSEEVKAPRRGALVSLPDGSFGKVEGYNPNMDRGFVNGKPYKASQMKPVVPPAHPIALPEESIKELAKPGTFIGVDLDKTLAHYTEWEGKTFIGEPIENTVNQVRSWLAEGKDVRIFTARTADDTDGAAKRAIEAWTKEHIGKVLPVENKKLPQMVAMIDDRGVNVAANDGTPATLAQAEQPSNPEAKQEVASAFKAGEFVYYGFKRVRYESGYTEMAVSKGTRSENKMAEVRTQEGGILRVPESSLSREPVGKPEASVTPQIPAAKQSTPQLTTTSNREKFRVAYTRHLQRAIQLNPSEYTYGLDKVPDVVNRMVDSLARGGANKDSAAIKATFKELGIKNNWESIRTYLATHHKVEEPNEQRIGEQQPTAAKTESGGSKDAVQQPSSAPLLQREPKEDGSEGGERGRVQQEQPGNEPARAGESNPPRRPEAAPEKPEQERRVVSREPFNLETPPADVGVKQWIADLPRSQRGYAQRVWSYLQEHGKDGLEGEIIPSDFGLTDDEAEAIDDHLVGIIDRERAAAEKVAPAASNRPTIAPEPKNEPVQGTRTARDAEDLSRVPNAAGAGGVAPATVPPRGNEAAEGKRRTEQGAGQPDAAGVERAGGQPEERDAPTRSGGTGAALHPSPEREGRSPDETRSSGRSGKPAVEPEHPEEAKKTTAELRNQRNFHISDEFAAQVGSGGEITKIKANLDALETLKTIQQDGRELATPEEQDVISRYVDFGGLVGMLQNYWKPEYAKHWERFNKILSNDEIQEIRETLPNTHYTSMQMVDFVWKVLNKLGIRGGRMLEPGMGIGNFIGRMPKKISDRAEILGVERNPLTGAMARLLYPDAKIAVKPFQEFMVPDGTLDFAIGNVPFQDVNVTGDPIYRKLKLNLHNYFIVKTLDKLKPGGIAALITSRYTLDSTKGTGERAREEMARRADLVAAIRLPDKAFKGNAGTEVVADLLVFRKLAAGDAPATMPDWTKTDTITVDGEKPIEKNLGYGRGTYIENQARTNPKDFYINKYFIAHPENVLGKHSQEGKMYGPGQYTVKAPEDFTTALDKAIELIPERIPSRTNIKETLNQPPTTLDPGELEFAPDQVKSGAFYRNEKGQLRVKESGVGKELPAELNTPAKRAVIEDAIDLREQMNKLIETQLTSGDDAPLAAEQKKLDKQYDRFVKKYGSLHGPKLRDAFSDDPEYPKLLALENRDPETKAIAKADIFTKRVLAPYDPLRELPDDPKAAMLKVMAERGYLDTKLMGDLLKQDEQQVVAGLVKDGLIYKDPQSGKYHTADEYLSGNVREKLRQARQALDHDPSFKSNVQALEKAQPEPLTIHDIQPGLGQTWIPELYYRQFVSHLLDRRVRAHNVTITRDAAGKWLVQVKQAPISSWDGGDIKAHKLVQYALNQQQPTVWITHSDGSRTLDGDRTTAARDKLTAIKDEFRNILRKAPEEEVKNLERIYNDTFNGWKLRDFNGEHLDFPGMSEEWRQKIRGYQKAMVWRILQEGRAGIYHAPGLGKTLTMIAAGMEARRLKLSRKNMYAVPNHMIPQWRNDFKRFYPNSNVLAVTDEDFTPTNRAKLMSRIATGDWDAVLVPHSQFDLLPMSPEWEKNTIEKRLDEYRRVLEDLDENEDKRTIKQIEKAIDKLEARLTDLNSKKKDNTIPFDKLGVDMTFVDEAHAYKSMAVPTKMGNIGGIATTASQRALALEMKADFMRDTHKGRGLIFATGTPITNTVGELYIQTKYLAPEMLAEAGINSFDDWAANFANSITTWEYAPDGVTFKPKVSLSEYVNVPELSTMFRRFGEYISKDMAKKLSNLKEPEADRKDRMLTITPVQEPLLQMIADRGQHLMEHPPRTKEERQADNWLKLSSDARKISLDARLFNPDLADHPESKANAAVADIKQVLDETAKEKGTVVVFSDFFQHLGDNGKPDFNLFHDMRQKLVKLGVPKDQLAIIHEAGDDKDEKEAMFAKVRAGKIRVLFGSTEKMGIGTNVQDRLKAELHLDQPWRPDQVEQREGRIVRSGNSWPRVNILRYIAEPRAGKVERFNQKTGQMEQAARPVAYDLQMYQQLERKAHFQEQFLTGQFAGRTMEDTGGDVKLNSQMFAIGKAAATGNPDAIRKLKLEHDLRTQETLERNFQVQRSKYTRQIAGLEYDIPITQKRVDVLQKDVDTWAANTKDGEGATLQIGDEQYKTKEQRQAYVESHRDIADLLGKKIVIGGLETELMTRESHITDDNNKWIEHTEFSYRLAGDTHRVPYDEAKHAYHISAFLSSFAQRARGLQTEVTRLKARIESQHQDLNKLLQETSGKSPYADKLEKMRTEMQDINQRLGLNKPAEVDEGADTGADDDDEDKPKGKGLKKPTSGESGAVVPAALNPVEYIRGAAQAVKRLNAAYDSAVQDLIDKTLKIGDKYHELKEYDPEIANSFHLIDNAPRYFREKAAANLKRTLEGLDDDQKRLASMLVDSDSRDYLEQKHPDEYQRATSDPAIIAALNKFAPLQKEMTNDRLALGWPVRRSLEVKEVEDAGPGEDKYIVVDRDGNPAEDEHGDPVPTFKTEGAAFQYVEDNGEIEPHLRRTYPEHMRQALPFEQGKGPRTGVYFDQGIRPPRTDKKAREASAEYFYDKGAHDFSGYLESFAKTKEAMLKQNTVDQFTGKAKKWQEGTAQPPSIEYGGVTYYRPDLATKMRWSGEKNVAEYASYDPTKGERFMIITPDYRTITTGRQGIGPRDRWLGPKQIVTAFNKYDAARGGETGKIRKFFQTQIVGLFGPAVHINNIIRRVGQATGIGAFDPRSWNDIAKILLSKDLRERAMKGVDDTTIDMLTQYGAMTDWRDIGNINHYIGGNLNPLNWIRTFSKGVLFDPKFANGWGGLDPKARIWVADYLRSQNPKLTDGEISQAVDDGFGNYNRANWTERQRRVASFTLFPGWDFASFKWFLKHPIVTAIAPALVMLAANLAANKLGLAKDQDKYDTSYLHIGNRKYRTGLISDSMGEHFGKGAAEGFRSLLEGGNARDVASATADGFIRGTAGLAGTLRPDAQAALELLANRRYLGGTSEIYGRADGNIPGTVLPNRKLEKLAVFTLIKAFPAVSRFFDQDQRADAMTGAGSIVGVANYRAGAEERLRTNAAKAMGYDETLRSLAETNPKEAETMVQDANKAAYLMFHGDLDQMAKDLKQIDEESTRVMAVPDLSADDRKTALKSLREAREQLLNAADTLNDQLFEARKRQ